MIGPHEGQELELMLAGKKSLAAFSDIIPEYGKIAEAIIPEKKFKPYVDSGQIIRFCEDYFSPDNHHIRIVCFTTIDQTWRAQAYIFLRKKLQMREIQYTNSCDEFFGLLLDYNPSDIQHFLNHGLQLNRT